MTCPVCGGGELSGYACDERFESRRCPVCGYVATRFRDGFTPATGYYGSIGSAAAFTRSVGAVRRRQMERLLDCAARHGVRGGRLLDIGSGHGWLLRAARSRGFDAYGIEPSLEADDPRVRRGCFPHTGFAGLKFDMVAAIDVIEHLPLPALDGFLSGARAALQRQGLLALKVPDAGGAILAASRGAHRLSGGRYRGPLDRMLQLNYAHPHVSYFTRDSLRRLLERHRFRVVAEQGDPEIAPGTIWGRVGCEQPLPLPLRLVSGAALWSLWLFALASGRKDALIVLARP
ncbi:MAG TPA: class I SAM-dependent methyltransferase [bacterium]